MIRRILLFALIAAAILGLVWLIRRSGSDKGAEKGKDLKGCLGVAEDGLTPGQVGRVRITDRAGDTVILSAVLDESLPGPVDKGTSLVVISNAQGDQPPVVSLNDLPGEQD